MNSVSQDHGCSNSQVRSYCCPTNDLPTCTWRGTAPFCNGQCHTGEVDVTSDTSGTGAGAYYCFVYSRSPLILTYHKDCWTGHKVLCCQQTASTAALSKCTWEGSAPFCSSPFGQASCSGNTSALTYSSVGAGGEEPCVVGSKSFCCDQPPPYQNCAWYAHGGNFLFVPFNCAGTCPGTKQLIATDPTGCLSGVQAFCCDAPITTNDPVVVTFQQQLTAFQANPTCPSDTRKYSRRDIDESFTPGLVARQANSPGASLFIDQLAAVVRGPQSYQQTLLLNTYDDIIGDPINLHASDFLGWWNDFPQTDPLTLSERLVCLYNDAIGYIGDYNTTASSICTTPVPGPSMPRPTRKRSDIKTGSSRRNLDLDEDSSAGDPGARVSTARIMMGIIQGDLRLEYMRLIHQLSNDDTILEGKPFFPPLYPPLNQMSFL